MDAVEKIHPVAFVLIQSANKRVREPENKFLI